MFIKEKDITQDIISFLSDANQKIVQSISESYNPDYNSTIISVDFKEKQRFLYSSYFTNNIKINLPNSVYIKKYKYHFKELAVLVDNYINNHFF